MRSFDGVNGNPESKFDVPYPGTQFTARPLQGCCRQYSGNRCKGKEYPVLIEFNSMDPKKGGRLRSDNRSNSRTLRTEPPG